MKLSGTDRRLKNKEKDKIIKSLQEINVKEREEKAKLELELEAILDQLANEKKENEKLQEKIHELEDGFKKEKSISATRLNNLHEKGRMLTELLASNNARMQELKDNEKLIQELQQELESLKNCCSQPVPEEPEQLREIFSPRGQELEKWNLGEKDIIRPWELTKAGSWEKDTKEKRREVIGKSRSFSEDEGEGITQNSTDEIFSPREDPVVEGILHKLQVQQW